MGFNSKLVSYFLEHFYTTEKHDLDHLMTPTFKFSVDGLGEMGFEEYTQRKEFLIKYVEYSFQLSEPDDDDDDSYLTCALKLVIPRVGQSILYGSAKMTIHVLNNKIDAIDVVFDASGEDNAAIVKAIKQIISLNSSVNFL